MPKLDLTASRWATADVRREREFQARIQTGTGTGTRTPSPNNQSQTPNATTTINNTKHASTSAPVAATPTPTPTPTPASAPAPPGIPLSSAQRQYLARLTELQRFRRLFRRLAWKANSLTHWSHRALTLAQEHHSQSHSHSHSHPDAAGNETHGLPPPAHPRQSNSGTDHDQNATPAGPRATLGPYEMVIDPIEAERQFKIDFFEFYALLERGLVCLLGVWGIVITPSAASSASATAGAIVGDSRLFHGTPHRFHANVLSALDHPASPLHGVLGTGDVRAYIGVAKEFRNKWKDVDHRGAESFVGDARAEEEWDRNKVQRYEKVLRDLRLEELLGCVLGGLEEAGASAEAEARRLERLCGMGGGEGRGNEEGRRGLDADVDMDMDMEDAPFEVMTESETVRVDFGYEMEF